MSGTRRGLPPSNPFSSRFVKPGALPYLFPEGMGIDQLIDRLRAQGWWGQIVGPHGSGKSTLLASLIPALRQAGHCPVLVALRDRKRRLPEGTWPPPLKTTILVVDGYEQLGFWQRLRLRRRCRRRGLGLIVTAHTSVGFPDLYQTPVSPQAAWQVVLRLLEPLGAETADDLGVTLEDLNVRLAARSGNFRDVLFELYDRFEDRPRGSKPSR